MGGKSRRRGCGTQDTDRMWMNTDPCGVICASFVWVIIGFCDFAIMVRAAEGTSSDA